MQADAAFETLKGAAMVGRLQPDRRAPPLVHSLLHPLTFMLYTVGWYTFRSACGQSQICCRGKVHHAPALGARIGDKLQGEVRSQECNQEEYLVLEATGGR